MEANQQVDLNTLPCEHLQGVGKRVAERLANLGIYSIQDLLFHLPVGLLDRRASPLLTEAKAGQIVSILLKADRHIAPTSRRAPYRIIASNESGTVELAFFNTDPQWVSRQFPYGSWRW